MTNRKLPILVAAMVVLYGCATLQTVPEPVAVAQTRGAALRLAEGVQTAVAIVDEVGRFVDTLPISDADKNAYDEAILAATGTSAAPGPLYQALDTLRDLTLEPSLHQTAGQVIAAVEPLLVKLEASDHAALAGFGVVLRAALQYAYSLTGGA